MNRPRIAIPLPTSHDLAYNRQNWPAYAEAILAAGGEPVQIPLAEQSTHDALGCSGFLLPGSPADVNPAGYGQARDPATALPDLARERMDRLILEAAEMTAKPLLAVCFGMQMLNVFYGGNLLQDIMVTPVNHAAGPSVAVAHTITVLEGSFFWELTESVEFKESTSEGRLPVNSSHHQALGVVGQGLRSCAWCAQDGIIEAVELEHGAATDRFLLGVQWHPERTAILSRISEALFSALVFHARTGEESRNPSIAAAQ
jgi:putative glutamine amidotransferase